MEKIVVGIDLGTTFSSVAYVDKDGIPTVIPNADNRNSTPSVVLIENGQITVGEIALNQWVTNEEHVVRWIKRSMGSPDYRFQGMSAVEISAEILKSLKADAELFMSMPLDEAVITCPAYFNTIEIENTKIAGEMAGFRVREIVKEPTAAAVYYGIEEMNDGETILVCDLGGGTFDATILKLENGVFKPLASKGDRRLGGHDWTMSLVEMIAGRFQEKFNEDPRDDLVAGQMLYEACEKAKRDFSKLASVVIPCMYEGKMEQFMVNRDDFEKNTEWQIHALVVRSEFSLDKAGITWKDIDRILLVGGSSRLRRMALALEKASGKKPMPGREPDFMVVKGAAILAHGKARPRRPRGGIMEAPGAGITEVIYERIITRNFGTRVIVFDEDKPRITNSLIIPHGTESPVSRSREDLEVSSDGQTFFDLPVVEFESDEDYEIINNYRFECLPGARRGDHVKVTFHYDISGILSADAIDLNSGKSLKMERLPYKEPDLEKIISIRVKPRWVVFAVDTSYSMEGEKLNNAKQVLKNKASELLDMGGGNYKVGIVSFASEAEIVCEPTSDPDQIERNVDEIYTSGSTAMDDGIGKAMEMVMSAPAGTDRDIVMLTDGMPDSDRKQNTVKMAQDVKSMGITLSTLGIGKEYVDLDFLMSLTELSLVIDAVDGMGDAVTTLLTQSAERRGGLIEAPTGGLYEKGGI